MVRQARQETQHPTHKANRSPDAGNHRALISHIPHRTLLFVLFVTRVTFTAAGAPSVYLNSATLARLGFPSRPVKRSFGRTSEESGERGMVAGKGFEPLTFGL